MPVRPLGHLGRSSFCWAKILGRMPEVSTSPASGSGGGAWARCLGSACRPLAKTACQGNDICYGFCSRRFGAWSSFEPFAVQFDFSLWERALHSTQSIE